MLASVLALGCTREPVIELRQWTLQTSAGQRDVTLPTHLDPWLEPRRQLYTLRARLEVPQHWRGRPLTLAIAGIEATTSLRSNGRPAVALESGVIPGQPSPAAHAFRIGADDTSSGALDLELEIDLRHLRGAWIDVVPRLSATPRGDSLYLAVRAVNGPITLCAFTLMSLIGFTYLGLFFFDRRRKVNLWFAVQCVGVAYYVLDQLGVPDAVIGPLEIGPLAASGAALSGVYFGHAYFHLGPPWAGWRLALMALLPALVGLVIIGPFGDARWVLAAPVVLACAAIVHQIHSLWRLAHRGSDRFSAALLLGAWVFTALCMATDIATTAGAGEIAAGAHLFALGPSTYAVAQAVVLARDHIRSLRAADALNVELAGRVAELEERDRENARLGDELRRQLIDRSQRLADALARIGAVPERFVALEPGADVHGRYRVVRALGQGGMGAVYEVERRSDGARLALKVLTSAGTGVALARLAREAQIAAQVAHENLVGMVDVDVSEAGALYVVMELVVGASLLEHADRHGDQRWALPILRQVARGLVALHQHGVVHRDLKPANVLLTEAGVAKIADFGIARLGAAPEADPLGATAAAVEDPGNAPTVAAPHTPALTGTGVLIGTPLYMAPDVARAGATVGPSADVFSFGVLAFELLLGRAPFDTPPILDALAGRPLSSPVIAAGALEPALEKLLSSCLAADPAARPSATEALAVLELASAAAPRA